MAADCCGLCEYKSTRFIRVRNKKLVSIYYLTLVLVLIYVVVYTVIIEKGYQSTDQVIGTASAKLKGSGSVGPNPPNFENPNTTTLDAMDLVIPPIEENAFFITTSYIITKSQTQTICNGTSELPSCTPEDATNCTANTYDSNSQGILTGRCSEAVYQYTNERYCEVRSWCPLEMDEKGPVNDPKEMQYVNNIGVFTAYIRNDIQFNKFDVKRTNTYNLHNNGAPIDGYNLWSIDEIISQATNGAIKNINETSERGAIVVMTSEWNCNLDKSLGECNAEWSFNRIDDQPNTISPGFNFRVVEYNSDMTQRLMRKVSGLRVIFITDGQAGKFDFASLTVTFGAGIAYLGLAAIITDMFLVNCMKKSDYYADFKNEVISDQSILANNDL